MKGFHVKHTKSHLAARRTKATREAFKNTRAVCRKARTSADQGALLALRSGSDVDTVARIAVDLEKSIKKRNGKANVTGAAAKIDRAFKARIEGEIPDNASRIMGPRDRGALRKYGFRLSGENSRAGGKHAKARIKADKLHTSHDRRIKVAKLTTRLDVLKARLTTPDLPVKFAYKTTKEISHITHKLTMMGV